ncbi:molybdate ABC transporter substrate-binding protein [Arhodomonas sp. SL1]|uniref:molybdate ABC transporter substrate-binding protein n=1 Tax=Arhodomonas sp. SL1 TaxID=3425691 RepID=UPI003F881535
MGLSAVLAAALVVTVMAGPAAAAELRIAAASDLKYALAEIAEGFRAEHPDARIDVIYGSSGKFATQIRNGAPFDLYFSADIAYPRSLHEEGYTGGPPRPYAVGRVVLWVTQSGLEGLSLAGLPEQEEIRKLAIANPQHAPYGKRGKEALEHAGVWAEIQPRLVMGENIAQTAQFVDSGVAEAGIVALSLVKSPPLRDKGSWSLIPAEWHQPLEQGYVVTARGADNPLAGAFAEYIADESARAVMRRYGFALPGR